MRLLNKNEVTEFRGLIMGKIMKNFSIVTRLLVFLLAWTTCIVHASSLADGDSLPATEIPTVRVLPSIRLESLDQKPIFTINQHAIAPFLIHPFVLEEQDVEVAPRIVAAQEGRVFLGKGHTAYVSGDLKENTLFQVFRISKPLIDPVTHKVIAHEAVYLGSLKLQRRAGMDEAHTFTVEHSKEEMSVGDRLLAIPPTSLPDYVPHLPKQQIEAHIVAVDGGMVYAGQHQVVVINRGMQDGLDVGSVLGLSKSINKVVNNLDNNLVKLPDQQYGVMLIFRVFNHLAYGLIMQVTDAVQIGDVARSAE